MAESFELVDEAVAVAVGVFGLTTAPPYGRRDGRDDRLGFGGVADDRFVPGLDRRRRDSEMRACGENRGPATRPGVSRLSSLHGAAAGSEVPPFIR